MLVFTADVRDYLDWFELTHQVDGGYGWVMWQRTALPSRGGLEDQPAKLMEALALIANVENELLRRQRKRRTKAKPTPKRDG